MGERQQIRFCTSSDGARIAYAVSGRGLPLMIAPRWLTHLEYEWHSPIVRPWLEEWSRHRTLIRLDLRGNGLSDRQPPSLSFDRWIEDVEAVVDALGLQQFDLFGATHGGATAIAYAAKHPERVTRLVLYCAQARGRLRRDDSPPAVDEARALRESIRLGWGQGDSAYRHVLVMKMMPEATPDQQQALSELMRICASGETAARLVDEIYQINVRHEAGRVRCPTLVMHVKRDATVPYEEGLLIASLIPGAEFVTLEGSNYFLFQTDPAWEQFCIEFRAFLAAPHQGAGSGFTGLTSREAEVLELMAHGQDNAQIAARLGLSGKTVRNHITSIFRKLQVENRAQAIVRARDAGYARRPL